MVSLGRLTPLPVSAGAAFSVCVVVLRNFLEEGKRRSETQDSSSTSRNRRSPFLLCKSWRVAKIREVELESCVSERRLPSSKKLRSTTTQTLKRRSGRNRKRR